MTMDAAGHARLEGLVSGLIDERSAVVQALTGVDPRLMTAPGLAGEWSARELIAHLGFWTGHATEALHHAEEGRLAEFGGPELDVEETNAVVARVARETDLATVRAREEAAFDALVARLRVADAAWLDERTAYGDTLEQVLLDDGVEHYREHALDVRAWFSGTDASEDDDEDDDGDNDAAGPDDDGDNDD